MDRAYEDAMWQARLASTTRLRWVARRSARQADAGTLDWVGHRRWAATLAVLRDRAG